MRQYIYFLLFFLVPFFSHASMTEGTIDDTDKYARICHDETCSTYGRINFKPTINASTPGAVAISITDSSITGHAWGDEVGWINFSPTGVGVTVDASTGALSGMAYANTGGWINFNPTSVSGGTAVDVTIDSNGEFTGWAWISGAYGGWIKFDCGNAGTCVKTDWRPESERSSNDEAEGGSTGSRAQQSTTTTDTVPDTLTPPFPPQSTPATPGQSNGVTNGAGSGEGNAGEGSEGGTIFGKIRTIFKDIETPTHHIPQYRVVPFSGPSISTEERPRCLFCLVIHTTKSGGKLYSVLKLNFVPETLELRIPLPGMLSNQDASVDVPLIGVDAMSIIFIIASVFVLIHFVIMRVFTLPAMLSGLRSIKT